MAIIGEAACLSAAIIALPAFLLWRRVRPLDEQRAGGENGVGAHLPADRDEPPTTSL
jgi:hypothetical protein